MAVAVLAGSYAIARDLGRQELDAPVTAGPALPVTATVAPTADPVSAALHVVRVLGSEAMYDPERRATALRDLGTSAAVTQVAAGFDRAALTLGLDDTGRSRDGELVARLVPVGQRLVSEDAGSAVVDVWAVGLLGVAGPTSAQPVQTSWSTERVSLVRSGSRWLWSAIERQDGPAPVGSAQPPASPTLLAEHAARFGAAP